MPKRRLAAIMFTDIEGYTALMQRSESEAIRVRTVHRQIFDEETARFNGAIIQYYGDGTLSIFKSALDAVQCATEMQKAFIREEIPVRIGLHSGDIVISNEEVIGDSVNLASRIESLAVTGSVLISEKVRDEIKNHQEVRTRFIDRFHLKNVSEPVGVYAVSNSGLVIPGSGDLRRKSRGRQPSRWNIPIGISLIAMIVVALWVLWGGIQRKPDAPVYQSIAVLPFDNFTGSPDLDYFVQGMHASLIGDLGKVSALRVISPTTARAYKDSGKSIPEIAEELNVDAVLEASVFCLGDSVCIQPKLIAVDPSENQLWVEDYYHEKEQILSLYHRIAKEISQQVNVALTPAEELLLATEQKIDPKAYELYLKGQFNLDQVNKRSLERAEQYFTLASEIEPGWAAPYAGLHSVLGYQKQMGFLPPDKATPLQAQYLNKAIVLDPNSAEVHYETGIFAVWTEFDWAKGEREFRKCIELNPNHALGHMFYAHLLTILRRMDEALAHAQIAAEIDPMRPLVLGLHAVVLTEAGECDNALEQIDKALSIEPDHFFAKIQKKRAYACKGNYDAAFQAWKASHMRLWSEYNVVDRYERAYLDGGWIAAQEEAIRINEELYARYGDIGLFAQGDRYAITGNGDKAVEFWEKALLYRDPDLPYVSCNSIYDRLKGNARYIEFLKKMGLPI